MKFSKNVNNKKHAPKMIFFNENFFCKDSKNFWHRKLTLKVRNWHFSIAWFRTYVDLPKKLLRWKSAIYHSIKLPFDVQVAEKFLNGIYCTCLQAKYYRVHLLISSTYNTTTTAKCAIKKDLFLSMTFEWGLPLETISLDVFLCSILGQTIILKICNDNKPPLAHEII